MALGISPNLSKIDKVLDVVSVRKRSRERAILVLPHSLFQFRGHPDVKVLKTTGKNVDIAELDHLPSHVGGVGDASRIQGSLHCGAKARLRSR
jgi:diacylglycerol kinase family enzyme